MPGLVLRDGAEGAAFEGDVGDDHGLEGVLPIPIADNGLDCVDVSDNSIFYDIGVNAIPRIELLD